ncbi:hypothetical protein IV203_031200 [Nitzschia inconspicua]|uniref:BSD domain-containing protein n=1 Tax=Nitzschia inconspicua TaxID=303405 RepID=A0A9K3Q271_9STRA|nr:hypothetical protein IV203_031200 [Nitzschia inconspicua]
MSSWFNTTGLSSTFNSISESVAKVTETVQNVIPEEYKEGLAKLTLNTEEMINERQSFREEALRKEAAKKLFQTLPWETKDAEREILVEECKDAILELSKHEETFFGPYEMPLLNVQLDDDEDDETGEIVDISHSEKESLDDPNDEGNVLVSEAPADQSEAPIVKPASKHRHMMPSEESKEKLAKLQPLPPLLEEFDLDAHVGLIQRVLKEDPVLVKMQANLSGGGTREQIFWKNYFFHCAFTRYEAGLSIDEIWSYHVQSVEENQDAQTVATLSGEQNAQGAAGREEETVVFDADPTEGTTESSHAGFQDMEKVVSDERKDAEAGGAADASVGQSDGSGNNGFDMLDDSVDGEAVDPELDELEAEILRELED